MMLEKGRTTVNNFIMYNSSMSPRSVQKRENDKSMTWPFNISDNQWGWLHRWTSEAYRSLQFP